jgi:hypothetical protein
MKCVDPGTLARQDRADEADWNEYQRRNTYATRLERAWPITVLVVLVGGTYEWHAVATGKFSIDIDGFIFLALLAGMAFARETNCVRACVLRGCANDRTDSAAVSDLRRHYGDHGAHRFGGSHRQNALHSFNQPYPRFLGLYLLLHHQPLRTVRRRPVGRGGVGCCSGSSWSGRGPGLGSRCYRYGCANSQHDPALLGIACRAPCRSPGRLSWHRCFSLPRGMSPTQLPRPTLTRNAAYGSSGSAA